MVPDPRPGQGGNNEITSHYHDEAFFLNHSFFASREILHFRTNNDASALLQHRVTICPVCGEDWLRTVITPHAIYSRGAVLWTTELRPCLSHGDGLIIPPHIERIDPSYPLPVLRHDALLHLERHKK